MFGITVHPFDGLGVAVVVADVAHELAGQVFDRGERYSPLGAAFKPSIAAAIT